MEDTAILDLFFSRDERAIREVSDKYGRLCRKISVNILENDADADECVNDTYLRAWNSIPPQRPASLIAYLSKIARNLSIDRLRERHSECRIVSEYCVSLEELGECVGGDDPPAGFDEDSFTGEVAEAVSRFLRTQSEAAKNAFILRYYEGESTKAIARRLYIPEGTVRSLLCRTRERLRKYLESEGFTR